MRRVALLCVVGLALPAAAQPEPPPPKKLTVSPAAEPRPARKFEFLPPLSRRTPGNAALSYNRAFSARPSWPADPMKSREQDKKVEQWWNAPVDQLPAKDVREFLAAYSRVFEEVERAATRESCDWEMTERLRTSGIGTVIDEVQPSREVTRVLALRIKLELAENRFQDAARSLQTGFQMTRHVGEAPTLIQMLVGLALSAIYLERVEEMIARPGSPNLYWALTGLPRPFINPRAPFEGEEMVFETMFPGFEKLNRGPLSNEEAYRIVDETLGRLQPLTKDEPGGSAAAFIGKLGLAGYVAFNSAAAKKELVDRGRAPKDVDAMAPAQAVMLNSLERYREVRDEQWKWVGLPYPEAAPGLAKATGRLKEARTKHPNDIFLTMFGLLLPATEKVFVASVRVERRFAALRAIEAVRMHAAANGGRPPASLDAITLVPVPLDPFTGKPFAYAAKDGGFTLTGPTPPGEQPNLNNTLGYEVTLRK